MSRKLSMFLVLATLLSMVTGVAYAQTPEPAKPAPMFCAEIPVLGLGPNGEEGVSLSTMSLTDEEAAKIKAGNFKAAIAMHYFAADWPQLQMKGMKDTLAKYGVEVIAATDGELKAEKQVADVESLIQLKPDVILIIAVDNDGLAGITKTIQQKGIKLVLIDTKPTGLVPGQDYVGLGAADNYGNGAIAADLLAKAIGGKGKVGLLRWGFHVFQTEQRRDGALATFKAKYPDVEIVWDDDVNSVEEGASACENLLTKDPEIKGFWTAWDGPGGACAQAAMNMGRKDVAVTTVDLSKDSGLMIAQGSTLKGSGAQHPYHQGISEAMIALYSLIGKEAPTYVAVPGSVVVKENIVCSMEGVFNEPPSQDLIDAAGPQSDVAVPTDLPGPPPAAPAAEPSAAASS